jgi:hypothetical protein
MTKKELLKVIENARTLNDVLTVRRGCVSLGLSTEERERLCYDAIDNMQQKAKENGNHPFADKKRSK